MKIITWNCNMAFRTKADIIIAENPDILIIQECEHPSKFKSHSLLHKPTDMLWFGQNQNKGLGIFSYSGFRFKVYEDHNPEFKMIIPIAVLGNEMEFNLFAVWAGNRTDPDGRYIEQVWKAVNHYEHRLKNSTNILIGDFNSNTNWNKEHRKWNHSDVVGFLENISIVSAYHLYYRLPQGKEEHPTHYLYRHQSRGFHIDYCFVSRDLAEKIQSVQVGDYSKWKPYSDHVPVIVTFRNEVSFSPQAFDRIGHRGPNRLETDGHQCDKQ